MKKQTTNKTKANANEYTWKMTIDAENEEAYIYKANAVGVLEYSTTVPYSTENPITVAAANTMFNALKTANV